MKTFLFLFISVYTVLNIVVAEECLNGTCIDTETSSKSILPAPEVCGINLDGMDRILSNSNKTKIGEFPWLAMLEYSKPNNKTGFYCAGVLISDRYVVTASHCINGKDIPKAWELISVRLGEWDLSTEIDCLPENPEECSPTPLNFLIDQKIPHEDYNPRNRNQLNNIALLRLKTAVQFNNFIRPICLPTTERINSVNFTDQNLIITSWGRTKKDNNDSKVKVKFPIRGVNLNTCQSVYSPLNVILGPTQICAKITTDVSFCTGIDGPLMGIDTITTSTPYWYLVGFTSFGPTSCTTDIPDVFTNIASYVDWIKSKIILEL